MSVFLPSFGGIQKGGIHIPYLPLTLPWKQRSFVLFVRGHCKLHAELLERWWGALCAVTAVYSEFRSWAHGHITSMASTALEQPALEQEGVSGVCMLSAVHEESAYGKVLGFVFVGSAVVA